MYLGVVPPDADNGQLQNVDATADNITNVNDEDGIPQLPTITTTNTTTNLTVNATNQTGNTALLACWIDFNRNGDFTDAGEVATAFVPSDPAVGRPFTLTFTGYSTPLSTGRTYIRCRITTAWTDPSQATPVGPADPDPTLNNGEVEDYAIDIQESCPNGMVKVSSLPSAPPKLNGVKLVITATSPFSNIKTVQCQKTINIDPTPVTGTITFTVNPPNALPPYNAGPPPTWTWAPPLPTTTTMEARRLGAGSATLACTITDSVGDVCSTDPVLETVVCVKGQSVTVPVNDGKPLPGTFRYVKIYNGSATEAGLSQLEISVNGTKFKQTAMRDDAAYFLDIASALRSDVDNVVTLTAKGRPDSTAAVFFSDGPIQ